MKVLKIKKRKKVEEKKSNLPPNHVWFYWEGWRVGKIIKKKSDNRMIVEGCTGTHHQIILNDKDKWVSARHKDFKGQNKLKEKKDDNDKGKKTKKNKGKKRVKIKITKRKLRKGKRLRIKKRKAD